MSTPVPDGLKQEINQGRMRVGNQVQDSTGNVTTTLSNPLYVGSDGLMSVTTPIPITVSSAQATTVAALSFTGTSSLSSGGGTMIQTFVTAAGATTVTSKGFVRVDVTDNGGNLAGSYYLQIYSIV